MVSKEITEEWLKAGNEMMRTWSVQSAAWWRSVVKEDEASALLPPHLDDLVGVNVKMASLMAAASELSRETVKYQMKLLPGYCEIGFGYARSLQSEDRQDFSSFGAALQDWLEYANKALLTLSNDEEILQQHNAFSEAFAKYRKCSQVLMDSVLEKMDMPTQTEMDAIGRTLAEMKRELRKLRKENKTMAIAPNQESAEPVSKKAVASDGVLELKPASIKQRVVA